MTSKLEETHNASMPLISQTIQEHEYVKDLIHALRFILRSSGGGEGGGQEPFIDGIARLNIYIDNLRRVAMSYHTVVGETIDEERNKLEKETQEQETCSQTA